MPSDWAQAALARAELVRAEAAKRRAYAASWQRGADALALDLERTAVDTLARERKARAQADGRAARRKHQREVAAGRRVALRKAEGEARLVVEQIEDRAWRELVVMVETAHRREAAARAEEASRRKRKGLSERAKRRAAAVELNTRLRSALGNFGEAHAQSASPDNTGGPGGGRGLSGEDPRFRVPVAHGGGAVYVDNHNGTRTLVYTPASPQTDAVQVRPQSPIVTGARPGSRAALPPVTVAFWKDIVEEAVPQAVTPPPSLHPAASPVASPWASPVLTPALSMVVSPRRVGPEAPGAEASRGPGQSPSRPRGHAVFPPAAGEADRLLQRGHDAATLDAKRRNLRDQRRHDAQARAERRDRAAEFTALLHGRAAVLREGDGPSLSPQRMLRDGSAPASPDGVPAMSPPPGAVGAEWDDVARFFLRAARVLQRAGRGFLERDYFAQVTAVRARAEQRAGAHPADFDAMAAPTGFTSWSIVSPRRREPPATRLLRRALAVAQRVTPATAAALPDAELLLLRRAACPEWSDGAPWAVPEDKVRVRVLEFDAAADPARAASVSRQRLTEVRRASAVSTEHLAGSAFGFNLPDDVADAADEALRAAQSGRRRNSVRSDSAPDKDHPDQGKEGQEDKQEDTLRSTKSEDGTQRSGTEASHDAGRPPTADRAASPSRDPPRRELRASSVVWSDGAVGQSRPGSSSPSRPESSRRPMSGHSNARPASGGSRPVSASFAPLPASDGDGSSRPLSRSGGRGQQVVSGIDLGVLNDAAAVRHQRSIDGDFFHIAGDRHRSSLFNASVNSGHRSATPSASITRSTAERPLAQSMEAAVYPVPGMGMYGAVAPRPASGDSRQSRSVEPRPLDPLQRAYQREQRRRTQHGYLRSIEQELQEKTAFLANNAEALVGAFKDTCAEKERRGRLLRERRRKKAADEEQGRRQAAAARRRAEFLQREWYAVEDICGRVELRLRFMHETMEIAVATAVVEIPGADRYAAQVLAEMKRRAKAGGRRWGSPTGTQGPPPASPLGVDMSVAIAAPKEAITAHRYDTLGALLRDADGKDPGTGKPSTSEGAKRTGPRVTPLPLAKKPQPTA